MRFTIQALTTRTESVIETCYLMEKSTFYMWYMWYYTMRKSTLTIAATMHHGYWGFMWFLESFKSEIASYGMCLLEQWDCSMHE